MHVLITGGAGFIGSHLVDYFLAKKYQVTVVDNLSSGKKEFISHNLTNSLFKFVQLDLAQEKKLIERLPANVNTVFHLAANSDIMRGAADTQIDFKDTTISTHNLLKAMQKKKIKKIFYLSGSGVYGNTGKRFVNENYGPLLPVSMYGATKLASEAMISCFVNLYDMQAWVLRPANIIGPRATHGVIFDFINRFKKDPKKLSILGDGNQSKSYIYVDDVVEGIDLVWRKSKEPFNLFNIGSISFIAVNKIAEMIMSEMKLNSVHITYSGGERGWKGDVPQIRLNTEKINKLGWLAQYTSCQAVKKTIQVLLTKDK